jgi:hypothetical protein
MSEPTHDPELAALQAALVRLAPAPDGINLGQLLYRAGQASVPRRGWAWPGATVASMLLAATLGAVLLLRPAPQSVVFVYVDRPSAPPEPFVARQSPAPAGPAATTADADWRQDEADSLRLRRQVLAHGVDALPAPAPWPAAAPPGDGDTLLDLPPGDARDPLLQRLKNSLRSGDAS